MKGTAKMHDIHILTHYPISDEDIACLNMLRTILNDEYEILTHILIETMTESGDTLIFVARAETRIVGMIILERCWVSEAGRMGRIRSFIVDPHVRSAGIGTQLLTRALSVADQSGVTKLELRVRPDREQARVLYKKHGFTADPRSCTGFSRTRQKVEP